LRHIQTSLGRLRGNRAISLARISLNLRIRRFLKKTAQEEVVLNASMFLKSRGARAASLESSYR